VKIVDDIIGEKRKERLIMTKINSLLSRFPAREKPYCCFSSMAQTTAFALLCVAPDVNTA